MSRMTKEQLKSPDLMPGPQNAAASKQKTQDFAHTQSPSLEQEPDGVFHISQIPPFSFASIDVQPNPQTAQDEPLPGITNFKRVSEGNDYEWTADLNMVNYLIANKKSPGIPKEEVENRVSQGNVQLRTWIELGKQDIFALRRTISREHEARITLTAKLYVDVIDISEAGSLIMAEDNPCMRFLYVADFPTRNTERNFEGLNQGIVTAIALTQPFFRETLTHFNWHANDARYKFDPETSHAQSSYDVGGHNSSDENTGDLRRTIEGLNFDVVNSTMYGKSSMLPGSSLLPSDFDALSSPKAQEFARKNNIKPILFPMTDLEGNLVSQHALGVGVLHHVFQPEAYETLLNTAVNMVNYLSALSGQSSPPENIDKLIEILAEKKSDFIVKNPHKDRVQKEAEDEARAKLILQEDKTKRKKKKSSNTGW